MLSHNRKLSSAQEVPTLSQAIHFPGQDRLILYAKALLDTKFNTKAITAVVQRYERGFKHHCETVTANIFVK